MTRAEWDAARTNPPSALVEGRATSKLTYVARVALLAGVGCLVASFLTREAGLVGVAVVSLLVAWGAGYLRRMGVGRWFL